MTNAETPAALLLERITALEAQMATIADHAAIGDVLTRYARACDWLDDALLETVLFDDAEIDYGFFKGNGKAFKPLLMTIERNIGRRWHLSLQHSIAINGDRAAVASYQLAYSVGATAPDPKVDLLVNVGYYIDEMVRREGHWGIIRRQHLQVTSAALKEAQVEGVLGQLNHIGTTSNTHPAYQIFTTPSSPA